MEQKIFDSCFLEVRSIGDIDMLNMILDRSNPSASLTAEDTAVTC